MWLISEYGYILTYIMKGAMVLFLGIGTVEDIRKRELPLWFFLFFGGAGLFIRVGCLLLGWRGASWLNDYTWLIGGMIGVLLAGVSKITGEAIGYGDAWAAGIFGIWRGWAMLLSVFFTGVVLTAGFGAVLFFTGKGNRKTRVPFFPFLFGGYVLLLLIRLLG